jgi:hypothetical protein
MANMTISPRLMDRRGDYQSLSGPRTPYRAGERGDIGGPEPDTGGDRG